MPKSSDSVSYCGVTTKRLNEQVKPNRETFPVDFMFQLTPEEAEALRSQIATGSQEHRNPRYLSYVFTDCMEFFCLAIISRAGENLLDKRFLLTFPQIYLMNQGKNQTGNIMQKDGCEENELNEHKTRPDCLI